MGQKKASPGENNQIGKTFVVGGLSCLAPPAKTSPACLCSPMQLHLGRREHATGGVWCRGGSVGVCWGGGVEWGWKGFEFETRGAKKRPLKEG